MVPMTTTGLRERKKRETFVRIVTAARELVSERGIAGVTVDDIAEAAGISTRTFFNYFSSKNEAVIGSDPQGLEAAASALRNRPSDERPARALWSVITGEGDDAMLQRWMLRNELVRRHPELLPRHLESFDLATRALTEAVADRMDVDQGRDPRPAFVVATTIAALRSVMAWWQASDRSTDLHVHLATTLTTLEMLDLDAFRPDPVDPVTARRERIS